VITAVGVWASNQVVRKLGIKDPQIVCIDEVAGVLITLLGSASELDRRCGWRGFGSACLTNSSHGPRMPLRACPKAGA